MDKIIFVVPRYGKEVNGGVEVHCKMLAERLCKYYDVEILTTCILDYTTFEEFYPAGDDRVNGIAVKRFHAVSYDEKKFESLKKKVVFARKLRRMIYRLKVTRILFSLFPVWHLYEKKEYKMMKADGFYSNDMQSYLLQNAKDFKAIIVLSYPYSTTHFGSMAAPKKTILIPTAHEESALFYSINSQLFNRVKYVAFNTKTEQQLCENIFKSGLTANDVVSVGVEIAPEDDIVAVKKKYNLPDKYVLYFGRVCESKMGKLFEYFSEYKRRYNNDIFLTVVGKIFLEDIPQNDYICCTGFVSENEKTTIIQHALLVINPSYNESLSLLLLEAMALGKTVLVNGKCEVLKQHCTDSDFAADYYLDEDSFCKKTDYYLSHQNVTVQNRSKAIDYVNNKYNWDVIIPKFKKIISAI